jgi:hypothetical protein
LDGWMDEEEVEWRGEWIDDWLYKRLEDCMSLMAEWMNKRADGWLDGRRNECFSWSCALIQIRFALLVSSDSATTCNSFISAHWVSLFIDI